MYIFGIKIMDMMLMYALNVDNYTKKNKYTLRILLIPIISIMIIGLIPFVISS